MSADVRDDAATVRAVLDYFDKPYERSRCQEGLKALARLEAAAARTEEIEKQRLADFEHANYIASCAEERIAELVARTAQKADAEASRPRQLTEGKVN